MIFIAAAFVVQTGSAGMSEKQLYAASMENDAQFIECVGNIFFGVAHLQRVIETDLKWEKKNSEFQKILKAKSFFNSASKDLSAAIVNSDRLLADLPASKKEKFEAQLSGFKSQVKNLNERIISMVADLDENRLPKIENIHEIVSLAIAGTGFGMKVSKENAEKK